MSKDSVHYWVDLEDKLFECEQKSLRTSSSTEWNRLQKRIARINDELSKAPTTSDHYWIKYSVQKNGIWNTQTEEHVITSAWHKEGVRASVAWDDFRGILMYDRDYDKAELIEIKSC